MLAPPVEGRTAEEVPKPGTIAGSLTDHAEQSAHALKLESLQN